MILSFVNEMIKRNKKLNTMEILLRQFEIGSCKNCWKLRRETVEPRQKELETMVIKLFS